LKNTGKIEIDLIDRSEATVEMAQLRNKPPEVDKVKQAFEAFMQLRENEVLKIFVVDYYGDFPSDFRSLWYRRNDKTDSNKRPVFERIVANGGVYYFIQQSNQEYKALHCSVCGESVPPNGKTKHIRLAHPEYQFYTEEGQFGFYNYRLHCQLCDAVIPGGEGIINHYLNKHSDYLMNRVVSDFEIPDDVHWQVFD